MDKLRKDSLVVLKTNTKRRRGTVLQVSRTGKVALVQFENHPRATLHAIEGLLVLSPSSQLVLFQARKEDQTTGGTRNVSTTSHKDYRHNPDRNNYRKPRSSG